LEGPRARNKYATWQMVLIVMVLKSAIPSQNKSKCKNYKNKSRKTMMLSIGNPMMMANRL